MNSVINTLPALVSEYAEIKLLFSFHNRRISATLCCGIVTDGGGGTPNKAS